MGITNKQTKNVDELLVVNSLFPRLLADYCERIGAKMIHISSDCVFSGDKGQYDETEHVDNPEMYGLSKAAGEPTNCTVIRTSLIGENRSNSKDLLEWVRNHDNDTIEGHIDKIWNGITCLQFAKICQEIIDKNLFWRGVKHVFSREYITKADLVALIAEVYELNIHITPYDTEWFCDRTLKTVRDDVSFVIPPIKQQLIEQRNFKL